VVIDRLRPHPHRGDVIAAGAVPLSLAAVVIDFRMIQWPLGVRFAVVALITAVLLSIAWLAELEQSSPRAYHSVLLIAGLLPLILGLILLAELLGASRPPGAGALGWTFAVEAGVAAAAARRANSAASTLIAALAGGIAVQALVQWIFHPHGQGTLRAIVVVLVLAYAAAATALRERRRRHSVAFVNAAGLATLALAGTYLVAGLGNLPRTPGVPFGLKAFLLVIGLGLVAYAAIDREPGPGYLGLAVLGAFAWFVGVPVVERGSLLGWPLLLLVIGVAGIVIGLRPRKPLPPSPDANISGPAPTVPLHPQKPQ
jgi:hypothetical protein